MRERYTNFLGRIARVGPSNDHEPFDTWDERVGGLLSNIPACVKQQWIHRHWPEVRQEWAWLDLRWLSFGRELWSLGRVVREVEAVQHDGIVARVDSDDWLAGQCSNWILERLRETGTWPVPPIILDNRLELKRPDGQRLPVPFTLVEGHRRLSFLLALHRRGHELRPQHEVWVMAADPRRVRKRWP